LLSEYALSLLTRNYGVEGLAEADDLESRSRLQTTPLFSSRKTKFLTSNPLLTKIFRPKRDEVTGKWRKLHNEELRDLYSSLSIIRIIKSRRMRWAGHVARMGEEERV
jgi:hypothetical protein